jgi:hypothetical protein
VGGSLEDLYFVFAHQKLDTLGEFQDDFAFALLCLIEIEGDGFGDDSVFFGMFELVKEIGGVQERFGRNAPAQQAGATEVLILFDDRGF